MAVITSINTGSSIAIQKKFAAAGGQSIDYDRQIVGGIGKVYVIFDGNLVGRAQAKGLVAGLKATGYGEARRRPALGWTDGSERVLVPEWQHRHPEPAVHDEGPDEGPAAVRARVATTNAQTIFEQMLAQDSNKIDGVIAANDNIAGSVIASLKAKGIDPIPLTGQDATVQGVQNIISGWQTMTVYKYVPDEANGCCSGRRRPAQRQEAEDQHDPAERRGKPMPTYTIPVVSITRSNFKRLFTDKFLKRSDVCVGEFAKYCVKPAPQP